MGLGPGGSGPPGTMGGPGAGVGGTIAFGRTPCHESAMPSSASEAPSSLGAASGGWATSDRVSVRGPFSPPTTARAATRRVVPGAGNGSASTTRLPGTAATAWRRPAFSMSFSPSA